MISLSYDTDPMVLFFKGLANKTRISLLKKYCQKGETYDELIRRLLEMAEQMEFARVQKRILENEEFVPLDQV